MSLLNLTLYYIKWLKNYYLVNFNVYQKKDTLGNNIMTKGKNEKKTSNADNIFAFFIQQYFGEISF